MKPGESEPVSPGAEPSEKQPGQEEQEAWSGQVLGVGAVGGPVLAPSLPFLSGEQGRASAYLGGKQKRIRTRP